MFDEDQTQHLGSIHEVTKRAQRKTQRDVILAAHLHQFPEIAYEEKKQLNLSQES